MYLKVNFKSRYINVFLAVLLITVFSYFFVLSNNGVNNSFIFASASDISERIYDAAYDSAEGFAYGSGNGKNAESAFLIATAAHLDNVRNYSDGSYFKLAADIDLTEYISDIALIEPDSANVYTDNYADTNNVFGFAPIGGRDNDGIFSGVFDGGGHTVRGLWMTDEAEGYWVTPRHAKLGLFARLQNAEIKNLTVVTADIGILGPRYPEIGTEGYGIIAGEMELSTISGCRVSGKVGGVEKAGGIVGTMKYATTISECLVDAEVISYGLYAGGVAGSAVNGVIKNCLVTGDIRCESKNDSVNGVQPSAEHLWTGGIVGGMDGGEMRCCFFSGTLIDYYMNYGGLIGEYSENSGSPSIISNYYASDKNPLVPAAGNRAELFTGAALDAEQQRNNASYDGWDWDGTWSMGANGPFLRAFGDVYDPPRPPDLSWLWITLGCTLFGSATIAAGALLYRRKKTVVVTNTVEVEKEVIKEVPKAVKPLPSDLSVRERRVAELLLQGKSRRDIAGEMNLTEGTVATYITRICIKAGVDGIREFMVDYLGGTQQIL